jgi:hypothetical protein
MDFLSVNGTVFSEIVVITVGKVTFAITILDIIHVGGPSMTSFVAIHM